MSDPVCFTRLPSIRKEDRTLLPSTTTDATTPQACAPRRRLLASCCSFPLEQPVAGPIVAADCPPLTDRGCNERLGPIDASDSHFRTSKSPIAEHSIYQLRPSGNQSVASAHNSQVGLSFGASML